MSRPVPSRVAVGLLILGLVFGYCVGLGSSWWLLAPLPFIAWGFIAANQTHGAHSAHLSSPQTNQRPFPGVPGPVVDESTRRTP